MKRLERKCLIASAVTHGLLFGLVFIGSAFLPHRKPDETVAFTLVAIPEMLVDEPNMVGGGNPKAGLPNIDPAPSEPLPQTSAPAPAPRESQVQPPPKPVETKTEVPIVESKPLPKPPDATPKFNLADAITKKAAPKPESSPAKAETSFDISKATRKTITPSGSPRNSNSSGASESSSASARDSQLAGAAGQALARVRGGLSSGVGEIGIPGPGGPAYASYNLALSKFYEDRWITPQTYTDNEPVVLTEVTIQGDGTVLSARILRKSGRKVLDDSVQKTLDRVKKVPAFPSGNKDEKRVFKINFNLSSKLNLG